MYLCTNVYSSLPATEWLDWFHPSDANSIIQGDGSGEGEFLLFPVLCLVVFLHVANGTYYNIYSIPLPTWVC